MRHGEQSIRYNLNPSTVVHEESSSPQFVRKAQQQYKRGRHSFVAAFGPENAVSRNR